MTPGLNVKLPPHIALVSKDPQAWANQVTTHLSDAAASVLQAGHILIKAKGTLVHGDWERMFRDHPQAVKHPIPFGHNTGFRLMAVASNEVLGKGAHVHLLPASWATLYELTKVPEPTLRKALSDGRIHPGMERRDVAALRSKHTPRGDVEDKGDEEQSESAMVETLHGRLLRVLEDLWIQWPRGSRDIFVDLLRQCTENYRERGGLR